MRFALTARAEKNYVKAPIRIQRAFDKQVKLLCDNPRHPSLDAKPYKDTHQARVTLSWRFYYDIDEDLYVVTSITKHP